ncbi:MAG: rod shape-determining protein MreC [Planctomycetes bacterium]|nr:rod shape-determining protein MreC [Planctomycetota bacterium]
MRRVRGSRSARLTLLALLPISGTLMLVSGRIHGPAQTAADGLFAPLARTGAALTAFLSDTGRAGRDLFQRGGRVRELEAEVDRLRAELAAQEARSQQQRQELVGLQQFLAQKRGASPQAEFITLARPVQSVGISAWAVASDASSYRYSCLADRGNEHGVEAGSPVTAGGALVGRVRAVGSKTSRVLLLVDPSFRAAVRLIPGKKPARAPDGGQQTADSALHGLLLGVRPGLCRVEYVPRDASVQPGDTVVTSGLDGQFPPGLWVGQVGRIARRDLFLDIEVRPGVTLESLQSLLILEKGLHSSASVD